MNKRRLIYRLRLANADAAIRKAAQELDERIAEAQSIYSAVPMADRIRAEMSARIKLHEAEVHAVLLRDMNESPCKFHVVQYSGGICSFFAAERVVKKFGKDSVTLLFSDVKMEDEDLYRFLKDTSEYLGVPVTTIADGRTPWEVFRHERYLGNTRADPCSKLLKRELIDAWLERNAPPGNIRYFGLDWTESDRFERLQARFEEKGISRNRICAPMIQWKPIVDKPDLLIKLSKMGIKLPRLYEMGYAHNNCGGACVKSGQAQWRLLLETMPERYAYHEQKEQELRDYLGKDVSILRDRRGGTVKPLTLRAFRERIQAGENHDRHDWGGCGCGVE